MATGLTNYSKALILQGDSWSNYLLEVELLTATYDRLQIAQLENRGDLLTPTGGTYAPLALPPIGEVISYITDTFDIVDSNGLDLLFPSLDTGGETIVGYAICAGDKILVVDQFDAYVPNGADYTVVVDSGVFTRFIFNDSPSLAFLSAGTIGPGVGFNPTTDPLTLYIVTGEPAGGTHLASDRSEWFVEEGLAKPIGEVTLVVEDAEVSLVPTVDLFTWDNLLIESGLPILGLMVAQDSYVLAYAKNPNGGLITDGTTFTFRLNKILSLNQAA
jgi:hypothetical protein